MKAHWGPKEYFAMKGLKLRLSADDVQGIRRGLKERAGRMNRSALLLASR